MPVLRGVFEQPDAIAGAARRLRDRGYVDIETYSPAPFEELDEARGNQTVHQAQPGK